jgi:hypothetical protein
MDITINRTLNLEQGAALAEAALKENVTPEKFIEVSVDRVIKECVSAYRQSLLAEGELGPLVWALSQLPEAERAELIWGLYAKARERGAKPPPGWPEALPG